MNTQTTLPVIDDAIRDITHLAWALRHYRAAPIEMACTRRPVVLYDRVSGTRSDSRR